MKQYFLEIRRRIILISLYFVLCFSLFFYYQAHLLHFLLKPLQHTLKAPEHLIMSSVASPVLLPLHITLHAAFFCTIPFLLLQIWRFIAPALYQQEQRWAKWMLAASMGLFILGVLFCFYFILPWMFQLFSMMTSAAILYLPDALSAIYFTLHMLIIFGLCFQLPLICVVLVKVGLVSFDTLKKIRPYVIVAAFILGMLLTPPDVISQILLAIPLCLLYEMGLLFLYCSST